MGARSTAWTSACVCAVLGLSAPIAGANDRDPLSAIDWLSDSVNLPETALAPAEEVAATRPPDVSVAVLGAEVPDAAGVMSAEALGLDLGLWGRTVAGDLAAATAALPSAHSAPPSLRRFLHELLSARLYPPIDAFDDDSLFLARLDGLLRLGQLETARRLIAAAGMTEPRRFRRAFDIALLTGTETEACRVIEMTPDLSPTYPARIFCLARLGQWDVAALTLGNAEALGILSPEEDQLLLHFLDAELFEGEPIPPAPRLPSPLIFRLYEAVGERLSTEQLPVAYAAADLSDTVGWKTRLRAAERLAAAEAIPFERFLDVHAERNPAASGGIWERVAAIQVLRKAEESGGDSELSAALSDAWRAAAEANYQAALARWLAPRLNGRDLDSEAAHIAFEMALLAGRPEMAASFARDTEADQFLLALAKGESAVLPSSDPLSRGLVRGLVALGPGFQDQAMIDDGRSGEALLSAITVLMDSAAVNPDRAGTALALLRALGLEELARQVAVELLLKESAA